MNPRRVVITGMGVISSLGTGCGAFSEALYAGRSGLHDLTIVDADDLSFHKAGEITDFDSGEIFSPREVRTLDRFAQFAVVAAREAVTSSGLEWDDELRSRTAVITGSCVGGQGTMDDEYVKLYRQGRKRLHPLTIPRIMANSGASQIALDHGVHGPAFTVSTACASSTHAIGLAFRMVRDGSSDCALAGGSEAPLVIGNLFAWDALRVVSPDLCRPFSKNRNGLLLGEGGAMLVLEPLERAIARGAPMLAEVCGFGMTSDAHHLTSASLAGPRDAMRLALDEAGLNPEDVDYINAHGTGTPGNDSNEVAAIRAAFGVAAENLLVSSTKSMHGHVLGGAGAIEAVATVLALRDGIAPPTVNYSEPDPECDLDVVPHEARSTELRAAISNSFAFGGLNAVIALRRWD